VTQLQAARDHVETPQLAAAAGRERVEPDALRERIAAGRAALPANRNRLSGRDFCVIGEGLSVKVNANLGTSATASDLDAEIAKLEAAEAAGADAVMDLSTGPELARVRAALLGRARAAFGTVPVYEAAVEAAARHGSTRAMTAGSLLDVVRRHAEEGVDFVTLHCGLTRRALQALDASGRVCGIVSRGGAILADWMRAREAENPLYERFEDLLGICAEHDVTLSLGDGLRPGALADSFDDAQVTELVELAALVRRARAAGVQVIVEGPGHVPLDEVTAQVKLQKRLCDGAPFYVLGPLVTDIAPGYDHIVGAIGGALAALAGADFLCYVTPSEHLGLPGPEEVRAGVVASRIAAHAADVARGVPGARERDEAFSRMRAALDWPGMIAGALDPAAAEAGHARGQAGEVCSMCGPLCVFRTNRGSQESQESNGQAGR